MSKNFIIIFEPYIRDSTAEFGGGDVATELCQQNKTLKRAPPSAVRCNDLLAIIREFNHALANIWPNSDNPVVQIKVCKFHLF